MKTYKITVTDTATYTISAETLEDAENLAVEWFSERKPDVKSEETCDTCYHNENEFSICQYCTEGNMYNKRYE